MCDFKYLNDNMCDLQIYLELSWRRKPLGSLRMLCPNQDIKMVLRSHMSTYIKKGAKGNEKNRI